MALLPANVLLPTSSSWLAAAVPLILQQDLASDPSAYAFPVPRSSSGYAAQATAEVQVTIENAPKLRYTVDVRDLSTQQNAEIFTADSLATVIASVDAIAKRLNAQASAFSTRSDQALRAYTQALQSGDIPDRMAKLHQAMEADPSFGLAYLALVQTEAETQSPELQPTISAARAHQATFSPYDRARLDLLLTHFPRRSLPTVADAASAVVKLAPHDVNALAELGTARFLQGNAAAGQQALANAIELNPADVQLHEQLATGFLETRQFARAEQLWNQTSPRSGLNTGTAVAALLAGERDRASAVVEKSLPPRAGENPFASIVRAQWASICGADVSAGPQRGLATIQTQAHLEGDVAASAALQSAIWLLQTGDDAGARAATLQGLHSAASPALKQTAEAVSLIVQAGSAPALRSRIEHLHADGVSKNFVLGYGFFLYRDYAAAVEPWRALVVATGDTDLRSRDMLATCLHRAGNNQGAFGIVVQPFVPNLTGTDPFATIAFNEMRQLLRL